MNYLLDWPEAIAVVMLVIGIFFALFSQNTFVLLSVCFLFGLMFGRLWFKLRMTNRVQVTLSISGFFVGFLIGALFESLRFIIFFLLAGIAIGYLIHSKRILVPDNT